MDTKEFRRHAHQIVDWMADFLEEIEEHRVVPTCQPGEIRDQLPPQAPTEAEPFSQILEDFQRQILPGMTLWNHPSWFAYFPANHSPPSILAEMLTACLGAQCMSWQTSPAATELEQVMMQWLQHAIGLSDAWTGCIQDTASSATLVALLCARERYSTHSFGAQGATSIQAPLCVYASKEAHSSIDKAVKIAGFGLENLRHIETDDDFAMRPDALAKAIAEDIAQGCKPACVVATVGTTSSTAVDPLAPISAICKQHDLWLHVDAAYAGSAAILPEMRQHFDGLEDADSLVFNPHKWLFTNFDCSAYFVRDVEILLRTFRSNPEYLKTAYDPQVVNFRDWGIPLGRRFRALKLWFVLRSYGIEGLRKLLRQHISWAQGFREQLEAHPDFEILAPSPFGLVCFRLHPPSIHDPQQLDSLNQQLLANTNANGSLHLTHTRLNGKYTLRLVVGQLYTSQKHVQAAWNILQHTANSILP